MEALVIEGLRDAVGVHRGEKLPARVTVRCKGYLGDAEPAHARGDMHGRVVNIRDVITFVGRVADLQKELENSIDLPRILREARPRA